MNSSSSGDFTEMKKSSGDFAEMKKKFSEMGVKTTTQEVKSAKSEIQDSNSNFEEDALNIHNEYRAMHGVPPLVLDNNLCKFSAEWARNLADRGVLQHRSNSAYGENLYCKYGSGEIDANATEATKSWYDEIEKYSFDRPGFNGGTGHFTQVIWRESRKFGIAKARNAKGQVFVVANYDPPGNVMGQFPENVPTVGASGVIHNSGASGVSLALEEAPVEEVDFPDMPIPEDLQDDTEEDSLSYSRFELDCLHAHNEYRSRHGSPPMRLNRQLCNFAAQWARHLLAMGRMQHRPHNRYGENLYMKWGSGNIHVGGREPVTSWYNEIHHYNFNRPGFSMSTGHFTQLVWASSRHLGVAIAERRGKVFVVANYSPPGNYAGQYPQNVRPPRRSSNL